MRLIDADALINTLQEVFDKREKEAGFTGDRGVMVTWNDAIYHIKTAPTIEELPSAQPDFSCDGCQTPKHICGICMRNYPNITDHYCTGEWAERRADGHEREN